ncbi:uncharacterized protein [Nicotiana sylvestris]|uniref:uncharacterized protein n=1 Tax=Nicotiana sylvestris TaxID=4096 RepID=UPI00388CC142
MPGAHSTQLVAAAQDYVVSVMPEDEQHRLERFGRLQPPIFNDAEGEDAHVQGSSPPSASASHSGARGSLHSPSPAPGSCYECGEMGHMRRQCPRRLASSSQQRDQSSTSVPVTSSSPTQPTRGGGQSARGCPRGGGRSGDGQALFYALQGRPDVIASDAVITGSESVLQD